MFREEQIPLGKQIFKEFIEVGEWRVEISASYCPSPSNCWVSTIDLSLGVVSSDYTSLRMACEGSIVVTLFPLARDKMV